MKTKGWMGTVALAALLGATGCSKNEGDGGGGGGSSNASKLEEYAMTPEWINYATAVSSELLDDCVGLWASWNGPSGIPDEDWNRIGRDFFSKNTIVGADGYAQYMRTASERSRCDPNDSGRRFRQHLERGRLVEDRKPELARAERTDERGRAASRVVVQLELDHRLLG
mgnify:CR=1 FL=1